MILTKYEVHAFFFYLAVFFATPDIKYYTALHDYTDVPKFLQMFLHQVVMFREKPSNKYRDTAGA